MNNLTVFKDEKLGQVRGINKNGEAWFVGAEIAENLGYQNGSRDINRHVDEEDRQKETIVFAGQRREVIIINESGLYSLILGSKLPNAKKFKRWITSEVIPQIRKTGGYIPVNEGMTEAEIMAKALLISQRTIEAKEELLRAKEIELKEKDNFINQIALSKNSLLVREVAKIANKNGVDIGEKRLWKLLREWGLILSKGTEPTQHAMNRGYFEVVEGTRSDRSKTFTYQTTRVTGKGQEYIIRRLIKLGGI